VHWYPASLDVHACVTPVNASRPASRSKAPDGFYNAATAPRDRTRSMPILRQGSHYLAFGVLQLVVDWAVFVALTALGISPAPANLAGRTSGAMLGFWLNGRYTFADDDGHRLGWRRFARFWALWLVMTAISTLLVAAVEAHLGLRQAWLAKPVVEAGLAMANFFLMRHLVYR